MKIKSLIKKVIQRTPSKANYKFLMKTWQPIFELQYASELLETKRFTTHLEPIVAEINSPKVICVLAPHPDDDVFGPGGTLIQHKQAGSKVHIIYVANLVACQEQSEAIKEDALSVCKALDATPHFMDLPTRNIPVTKYVTSKLATLINTIKPDQIFISHLLDDHDDHRRVNELLLHTFPALTHQFELWAYQVYSSLIPNVIVDISHVIDEKSEIMQLWQNVPGNRNWPHYVRGVNAANCRYLPGKKESYSEAFFVLPAKEYIELCRQYFGKHSHKRYQTKHYSNEAVT